MKKLLLAILAISFTTFTLSSCVHTYETRGNSGKVPPGQMKKRTGSKSAKPYAPGQQKKHY
ncbi:hypothetical protein LX64_00029 [Chitinophaga skermanii]|uniref:Quinol oxidase subunit 4 n=1 Tax=Chitinophaga skermanii TaxID=331697 RepID=A0A327R931_9BACT|nr:hypothetical protein LX64_00029 [Chitinophaga skermanii]